MVTAAEYYKKEQKIYSIEDNPKSFGVLRSSFPEDIAANLGNSVDSVSTYIVNTYVQR
jgi:hypothetical protein